jgi:predicted ATPase
MGRVLQGCIAVRGGDFETGLTTLKAAVPDYRATRAQSSLPVFLSFLASALSRCGKSEEAFATVAEALQLSETTLEVCWEAELYRLKGELTLDQSSVQRLVSSVQKNQKSKADPELRRRGKGQKAKMTHPQHPTPSPQPEAEECFHKAIEIARQQGAKSLELRAAISLSRLWQQQEKKAEARQLLAETYNWFTEGFDTQDLQDAKALLAQLA